MIGIRRCFAAAVAALALASAASAQVFTGRIDVTVRDANGGRLPGVAVDVSGPETQTQIAHATGQAHLVDLPVRTYTVKLTPARFTPYTSDRVLVESRSSTPAQAHLAADRTA